MPTPTVTELAQLFKAAIDRQDAAALTRLAKTYKGLYARMQGKLDSYLLALSRLENPTQGQVFRLSQYKNLITALETELTKYSAYVEVEIRNSVDGAVEMAIKQTKAYLAAAGYSMPATLPKDAIISMLGFLKEDAPLWGRLNKLAPMNAQKVADALLEGIAFGYNPAKTARLFENVMGGGLTDAMRTARTAQMYAHNEASRAMYVANDDVVEGWVWYSSLDTDTCMACAAEHGTFHTNDESMDGHYNCRCCSIPVVKGYDDKIQTGEDWFAGLTEKQQRDMMGAETWQAWKDGKFDLSDMAGRRHDDVYGEMLARVPLQDLIGNVTTDESITQDYDTTETGKPIKDQTVYRYGDDSGKVSFYSLERDYAEEYAGVRGGRSSDVRKVSINMKNPLVVNVSSINFSDPDYENPIIERAMRSKHDGIVFVSEDGYDRFFVKFNK